MQTHELKRKTPLKKSIRVGRGGKRGKTSGRGGKGQTARAGNKRRPEMRDFIKRLPKLRGRGVNQNKPVSQPYVPVNLASIEASYKDGEKVTPATLLKKGLIKLTKGKKPAVKILGTGNIIKKVTLASVTVSTAVREKIEKAGGKVLV